MMGIYLVEPHAKWIYEGKKKLIVKSRAFYGMLRRKLVLLGEFAYGIIELTDLYEIDLEKFRQLYELHRITDEERKEWWPGKAKLYAYEFVFEPFQKPLGYVKPPGIQTFIEEVQFKDSLKKIRYMGGKQKLLEEILKLMPEEMETFFDPMCGSSAIPYALAKKGVKVWVNDFHPLAYHYSRGILQGTPIREETSEKVVNAKPERGYLTSSHYLQPERVRLRMVIDGMVLQAKKLASSHCTEGEAKSLLAALVWWLLRISPQRLLMKPLTEKKIRKAFLRATRAINDLVSCERAPSKVTNYDAREIVFPKVDVVYFDPPYIRKGDSKPLFSYLQLHKPLIETFLQKRFAIPKDLTVEETIEIGKRLKHSAKTLIISDRRKSAFNWKNILDGEVRYVTYYSGGGPHHRGGGRGQVQRERLIYITKSSESEDESITLHFYGTKGEIEEESPRHKYESSTLLSYDDYSILLDLGELYNPAILGLKPIAILITHAHPDHAYGLKDEKIQNWLSEQRIELYSHKEAIELLPEELPFTEVKPLKAFRIGPFEITAVPVYHSIKAPAVAYLIEVGGQRIWYSPDFLWLKKEQHGHLKDLDVYIGDGSSLTRTLLRRKDKEIFGHMSVKKQLNLLTRLNPEGLPHVIFTHFGKEGVEHEDLQGFLNDLSPELSPVAAYDCLQLKVTGLRKLELERFRHEGIDEDIERKWERWPELIADLRYLWNSAYPRLKRGQKWGEWTLEDVLRYGAKIVDTLRSMYFPIMPPKPLPKTSYWQAYREAEKYMKSKPPADEQELAAWEAKRKRLFEIGKLKRRR